MKQVHVFLVRGKFPTLNDLLRQHGVSPFLYDKTKKHWENLVASTVRRIDIPAFKSASITYMFLEKNRRRDPSNIASAAIKFIEDALVRLCVLPGDGWNAIEAIEVKWFLETIQGVSVKIEGEVYDEPRERIYERKLKEERAKKLGKPKRSREGAVGATKRTGVVRKARKPCSQSSGARVLARPVR